MPDLDDLLNPSAGRDLVSLAGDAAHPGDVDALTRRGVRRGRRVRLAAVAGVAAATALAVGVGVGVSGTLTSRPSPVDGPAPDRSAPADTEDLPPLSEVAADDLVSDPRASRGRVVLGADEGSRLELWSAREGGECLEVAATTVDDGATWSYRSLPGRGAPLCGEVQDVEPLGDSGGRWALTRYARTEVLVVDDAGGEVDRVRPAQTRDLADRLRDDETLLTAGGDLLSVAITSEGRARILGWDSPDSPTAERLDVDRRIVSAAAGEQLTVEGGFCCYSGAAVRWSDNGGLTFDTYRLADAGPAPGAVDSEFGLFAVPTSYASGTLVAVEGGETTRGPGADAELTYPGVHRSVDGGTTWERFEILPGRGSIDVDWSLVAPDGSLLVHHRRLGLLATDGTDWSSLEPTDTDPAPVGTELELLDDRLVDGELHLVVRTRSDDVLLSRDAGLTWSPLEPAS